MAHSGLFVDPAFVRRIVAEGDQPLPILVSGVEQAAALVQLDDRVRALAQRFWPGALTIVANRIGGPDPVHGQATLGLRAPDLGWLRELIDDVDIQNSIAETEIPWSLHLNEELPEREIRWALSDGFTPIGEQMLDPNGNPMRTPDGEIVHLVAPALSLPTTAVHCRDCDVHTSCREGRGGEHPEVCPVCQSSDLEVDKQANLIGHGVQSFSISKDESRRRLQTYLAQSSGAAGAFERSDQSLSVSVCGSPSSPPKSSKRSCAENATLPPKRCALPCSSVT